MLKAIVLAHRQHLKLFYFTSACKPSAPARLVECKRRLTHSAAARVHPYADANSNSSQLTVPAVQPTYYQLTSAKNEQVKLLLHLYGIEKTKAFQLLHSSPSLTTLFQDGKAVRRLCENLASSQTPKDALAGLRLANDTGLQIRLATYESVCFHLAAASQWQLILKTVLMAQTYTTRGTSIRLLNWRARALLECRNYRHLQSILQEFERFGEAPNRLTFHLLLTGHIRNCDILGAKDIMRQMEDAGSPVNASTHALIARAYRQLGIDEAVEEKALEHLPHMDEPSRVAVLNSLLRSHLDSKDLQNVHRFLSLFDRNSVEIISEVLFGKDTVGDMARSSHTSSLTTVTLSEPPSPNASTFSIFIHHCSKNADLDGALQLLHCMVSQNVVPTVHAIKSLIHACFSCARPDLAVQLVAGTCDLGATPHSLFDPIYPGTWTDHCFEIHVPGMRPCIQIFNALLQGILPVHGVGGATTVMHIMQVNRVQPNERTLELLLSHMGRVEKAHPRTLIRLLRTFTHADLEPTAKHLRIIFRSVFQQEKHLLNGVGWNAQRFSRNTQRQLPAIRSSQTSPNFDTFAGIEFPKFRDYGYLMEPFLDFMQSHGIKPDSATMAMRIRHEAVVKKDMDAAHDVFRAMLARGMRPNAYHYASLMEGYAICGDAATAAHVLESAKQAGVVPNALLFTILITAHARAGNPTQALKVFQQMVEYGISPDVPSVDAVSSAFFAVGANAMAKRVLISLWSHFEPFPHDLQSKRVLALAAEFRERYSKPGTTTTSLSEEKRLEIHLQLARLVKQWQLTRTLGRYHTPWKQLVSRYARLRMKH